MKNLTLRTIGSVVLAIIFIASCNENTIDPVFYGQIEGNVTLDVSGNPAQGIEITTNPATTKVITDDNGYYFISDVPVGEYTVIASAEAYRNATERVRVTRDNTTRADLSLEPDAEEPNRPTVASPAQGATGVARTTELKWSQVEKNDDALTYDVVLYESNRPEPILDITEHPDTVVQVADLKFNTTYFWQVTAVNSAGVGVNGELWQFTTLPFPDNRFLFASQRNGNYDIFSSNETGTDLAQITSSDKDQVYPKYSNDRLRIAFTENTDLEYHLYVMGRDGSDKQKVTTLPVTGFHNQGKGFCWSPDNGRLMYSHYDKLYVIDRDGTNRELVATAPAGRNYRGCDWTAVGDRVVVETIGVLPYESEIRLIDLDDATDDEIISDEAGTIQSPSFSIDGTKILFTKDVSGFESQDGRMLDSRVFLYDINTTTRTELSKDKVAGTNDLNPRFSPDGSKVIIENRSNDGSGLPTIFTFDIAKNQRAKLFDNAAMPDWK